MCRRDRTTSSAWPSTPSRTPSSTPTPPRWRGATIYIVGVNADGSLASGKPCLLCRRMLRNAKLAKVVYYETDGSVVSCRPDEIHD